MEELHQNIENLFVKDDFTDILAFIKTVDWTESWLIGLLTFHVTLTIITIATRNYYTLQGILFFLLLLSVRCSEIINEYAAKNWNRFSNQQYFDSRGLFISVVFSMPILFNCLMMVINWLWQSSNMMARVKRAELERKCNENQSGKISSKKKKE